ncbi:MAG: HAD family hydrolase [Proteobacteria bacterium]|nr:HAD family hydrolase [Pseudomonadota bacterium]MBU1714396.1 HAD family hydrolase [Pseudomonadota bacterium]
MTALKLIIFDCDGVMFDSKNANRYFYNQLLTNFSLPPMDDEELEYVHMHHVLDSVRHIFRNHDFDLEEVNQYRLSLDYGNFLQYMTMEPDLIEFLEFIKPAQKAAISTNRTTTMRPILEAFGLKPYFEKVVTPMDVEQGKPHPEALHKILDHFHLTVPETIYIGDSIVDREHTDSLGMRMIAFKNPALSAEFHVNSFMEITGLPIF